MAGVIDGSSAVLSDRSLQLGGSTFEYAEFKSVSLIRPILSPLIGWVVAVVGLIILVAGYLIWRTFLTPMLAGAVLLIVGVIVALVVRETYTVRLNRRQGEPLLLQFKDGEVAQRTVTKIGAALDQQHTPDETGIRREAGS